MPERLAYGFKRHTFDIGVEELNKTPFHKKNIAIKYEGARRRQSFHHANEF